MSAGTDRSSSPEGGAAARDRAPEGPGGRPAAAAAPGPLSAPAAVAPPSPYGPEAGTETGTGPGARHGTGAGAGGSGAADGGAEPLAVTAARHADVCLIGVLTADEDGASWELALPGAAPAGAWPVVVRGTMAYGVVPSTGRPGWLPLRRIGVLGDDGTVRDLAELDGPERIAALRAAGREMKNRFPKVYDHVFGGTGADGADGVAGAGVDGARGDDALVRTAERETLAALAEACGSLAGSLVPPPGDDVAALRRVQERCRDLYGRLEPERALAWTLEELGELAQAMRRGESTVRLEEELGQVLVWAFCLANITRTDASHAFAKAYGEEYDRQLRKHGAVRPYRREVLPC